MKRLFSMLALFGFLISCNVINLHNVKNDFRWKNKKLSKHLKIHLAFNPIVIKDFDSTSSLVYYFKDSNKITDIKTALKKKLSRRNFIITPYESQNTITIDTILFLDKAEMVQVLSNDANDVLGDYEKNDIKLKIVGYLNISDSIMARITSEYRYTDEPRESYLIEGSIAYTNAWINLDKVINNIVNEFSYKCYKKIESN